MCAEASSFSLQELVDLEEMRTNAPRISAVVFSLIATLTCSFDQLQVLPGWPHPPPAFTLLLLPCAAFPLTLLRMDL